MGLRWARLLIKRKDTALITGAPVWQAFSHESNVSKNNQNIYNMILFSITRYCCPGSVGFSARTISIPVSYHHRCISRAEHRYLRRIHTSRLLDDFIAGTATSPYVILLVVAVIIFRVHFTINLDLSTMINTCCGLALAVCVSDEWAFPYVLYSLRV